MLEIRSILENLGYSLKDFNNEYRCRPVYRDSDNENSLRINKQTGYWTDFGLSVSGNFEDLIKITLNLKDIGEAKEWLKTKHNYTGQVISAKISKVTMPTTFNKSIINELTQYHEYWVQRGISLNTIKEFNGGVSQVGSMKDRYVFPIFNSVSEIVGLAGRTLKNSKIKWKLKGVKANWVYPGHLNTKNIKQNKYVILVESIGDLLSLWDVGIKNVLVTFGTELSFAIINFLIKVDVDNIYISLNNDQNNNLIGNKASEKICNKLARYFDKKSIHITLPPSKDWNEVSSEERKNFWKILNA
jgi:Toprim domain-containing protein